MSTISAHEHARIMYREMLMSLKKFNEAEAQIADLVEAELKAMSTGYKPTAVELEIAEKRADARATDRGIYGRLNYHRERVNMHALAYGVSVNYGQTFERNGRH